MNREELSAYLASIVDATDDAIMSANRDGTIVSWNRGAERLLGYSPGEAIGQSIAMLVPPESANSILERIHRGEAAGSFESEKVHKDGRRIPVSLTVSPVRDKQGHVAGACTI